MHSEDRQILLAGPGRRPFGRPYSRRGFGGIWFRGLLGLAAASVAVAISIRYLGDVLGGRGEAERMASYAQDYAKSVACVAVEYRVRNGKETVHEGLTFGTAFLVDRQGRLLTNRHVACPWLSDEAFDRACQNVRDKGWMPEFSYRMWVWFEGAPALRKNRDVDEDPQLEDVFVAEGAYRTDAENPTAAIVGVRPEPLSVSGKGDSLENDLAIIQVSPAPSTLEPLPLAAASAPAPGRLEPVLALGFPLGVQAMPDQVVAVSATIGHVRRCFRNMIQVDVSLHSGNSGGPVVDSHGRVIGIASQVCRDEGLFFSQPQSDMGQILPIACARGLLDAVAAGEPQWNGVVDPGQEEKLEQLWKVARSGDRAGACRLECNMRSQEPERLLAGAALHAGGGDLDTALARLKELLELYHDCAEGVFLRLLLTRGQLTKSVPPETARLLDLDWRSDKEFYGYLARVVTGRVPLRETQDGWDDPSERALLDLVVGLSFEDKRDFEMAEALYQKAVIGLGDAEVWQKELAWSALERVQMARSGSLSSPAEIKQYGAAKSAFLRRAEAGGRTKKKTAERIKKFERTCDEEGEVKALSVMVKAEPLDSQYPIALVFELAKEGRWPAAAEACGRIKPCGGRESANRLGIGLLRVQLLRLAKRPSDSRKALQTFLSATKDPWYRDLARLAGGELQERDLTVRAFEDSARQVTLHSALGLKLEAEGDLVSAANHYRAALDSGLSHWYESSLARARIEALKAGGPSLR